MSEKYTLIELPGAPGGKGFMDHGELTADRLIADYRAMWQRELEHAQAVLAAADEDFAIRVVRGVHVQHIVKVLQEGRPR